MPAPAKIVELVKRFQDNADDYRAPQYGETQTRIEFINPFFECLGWDIDNRRGAAEKYKDVIHEAAIKIGGVTKAPDYCFRFGGNPIFFLEAKKAAFLEQIESWREFVRQNKTPNKLFESLCASCQQ